MRSLSWPQRRPLRRIYVKLRMEIPRNVDLMLIPPQRLSSTRIGQGIPAQGWERASAEMTSPVSGLKETRLSRGTRLEKFMKRKTRTHKTSLQGIATRAARLPVFAVSLATLRFGLFANTDIQATGDIVWVTAGNSIAAYYANGTALPSFNLIIEQSWPSPGGILVSGHSLYVPSDWWACCPNRAFVYALLKREAYYVFTTYNADTGSVTGSSWYTI